LFIERVGGGALKDCKVKKWPGDPDSLFMVILVTEPYLNEEILEPAVDSPAAGTWSIADAIYAPYLHT
jgi:hypothetical protein